MSETRQDAIVRIGKLMDESITLTGKDAGENGRNKKALGPTIPTGATDMPKVNGHKNWNHWNVSLWLNNDEPLYREMIHFLGYASNKDHAARMMADSLKSKGVTHTRDGAPFSYTTIRAAMRGWEY